MSFIFACGKRYGVLIGRSQEAFDNIKTYYLNHADTEIQGVFSGLDIENRLISRELVDYQPAPHNNHY